MQIFTINNYKCFIPCLNIFLSKLKTVGITYLTKLVLIVQTSVKSDPLLSEYPKKGQSVPLLCHALTGRCMREGEKIIPRMGIYH